MIESGADLTPEFARHLSPPLPRSQSVLDSPESATSIAPRRSRVNIDQSRAMQIQQALNQRGFYFGEASGVYDEETIEAMRRFQTSQKISATGYPTAHALKRLGLAKW
ncbi:MAG: peptidoglycan-binding protein [Blastocatellales bacterium]